MSIATTPLPEHDRLLRKLDRIAELSAPDRKALRQMPMAIRSYGADQDIVRQGDRSSECCLILDGFVCRYKLLADGRRQIMAFHMPGDIPDLQGLYLDVMDHALGTIAPTRAAFILHEHVEAMMREYPGVATALWRDALIDAAIFREWLVGLGRRSARQRVAHLLCELVVRLEAVGLGAKESPTVLPITQAELGDALGLSTVHINRVLQDFRAADLLTWRGSTLHVRDWEGLQAAGEFEDQYLHRSR